LILSLTLLIGGAYLVSWSYHKFNNIYLVFVINTLIVIIFLYFQEKLVFATEKEKDRLFLLSKKEKQDEN
jgi:hypothetical protein